MVTEFVYLLRPFLSYAFVCVYLEQRTDTNADNKIKKKKKDKRHKTRMKEKTKTFVMRLIHRPGAVDLANQSGMLVESGLSVSPCCCRKDCPARWQRKEKVEQAKGTAAPSILLRVAARVYFHGDR